MANAELAPTFTNGTAENAYDVHVLIQRWDGDIVDKQMPYDPATALHFKSHGLMNELDVGKLEADNVISGADQTASYFSFTDYAQAVTQDYNEAMKGAASVYNDIMAEVDPGGRSTMDVGAGAIEGIHDRNNLHWEFTDQVLESAIESARRLNDMSGTNDMDPLIEQGIAARQALQNAGANAVYASEEMFWGNIPRPANIELTEPVEFVDFSKYEIGSGVDAGVDVKPPQ